MNIVGNCSRILSFPKIYRRRIQLINRCRLVKPFPSYVASSDTCTSQPPFFFTIDEIAENPSAVHQVDNNGHWIPSTDRHTNFRVAGGTTGRKYYCDRQQIREVNQLPAGCRIFKQYSVYFIGGYGFRVLRGDAINPPPGDTWQPLRFEHSEQDFSSFLTSAGLQPTLQFQRNGQQWPRMLLPDIYHTHETPNTPPSMQAYGGLTGELPIFLALVAFSVPRDYLPSVLPTIFTGGAWAIHHYRYPRESLAVTSNGLNHD